MVSFKKKKLIMMLLFSISFPLIYVEKEILGFNDVDDDAYLWVLYNIRYFTVKGTYETEKLS